MVALYLASWLALDLAVENLKALPASAVKIDRSFVSGLPLNAGDAAVVEAIVAMAGRMGLEVVAEGIEDEEQLAFLRAVGCGLAQGFLLGRPVAGEEFARSFLDG